MTERKRDRRSLTPDSIHILKVNGSLINLFFSIGVIKYWQNENSAGNYSLLVYIFYRELKDNQIVVIKSPLHAHLMLLPSSGASVSRLTCLPEVSGRPIKTFEIVQTTNSSKHDISTVRGMTCFYNHYTVRAYLFLRVIHTTTEVDCSAEK